MPETTNEDGTVLKETTADDHTSVCFKKSLFDIPELKGKCTVVKLNGVKTSYVDAYPVMTKSFDVFKPFEKTKKGKVFEVGFYTCEG